MAVSERVLRENTRVSDSSAWRGSAFGLALEAPGPLPNVRAGPVGRGRRAVVELVSVSALDRSWPVREAKSVVERRFPDGAAMLQIDHHPEMGYRVWAPGHGRYVVSPAGDRIRAALPLRTWRWQRLFFAQVLPLAAALRGLEPFHASAVALDGRAIAFVAPSGTGKTSVAAHFVAAGASLVTDDVLVLEPTSRGVLAHPGSGLVNLDESELRAMDELGRRRLGQILGRSEKLHFSTDVIDRGVPLDLVYFLRRDGREGALAISADSRSTQQLLAAGFLAYLRSPARLVNHLDACAKLSEVALTCSVDVPAGLPARVLAKEIGAHAAVHLARCRR